MHPTKSEKLPVQKNVINVERYRFNDMIQVHFDDNEPHSRAHSQQCTMHRINLQVTVLAYFFSSTYYLPMMTNKIAQKWK